MDELDQVEEVVDAQPEPEVAPEPAPEAEPAPAEFDYEPSFLNEDPVAPEPPPQAPPQQQQWSPQQVAAYNQQMQMQQPQVTQQEELLNNLVRDTRGTIGPIAEERAQYVASQMINQALGPVAQQTQRFIEGQTRNHINVAKTQIRDMYSKRINNDEVFSSNPAVKEMVNTTVEGFLKNAARESMNGNPDGFSVFYDPTFADALLASAKAIAGHKPSAVSAVAAPHVESVVPAAQQTSIELSPDQEEAVRRMGPGGRDRYIKALEELKKNDDFEWDE